MKTVLLVAFAVAVIAFAQFNTGSEAQKVTEIESVCSTAEAPTKAIDDTADTMDRNPLCTDWQVQDVRRVPSPEGSFRSSPFG